MSAGGSSTGPERETGGATARPGLGAAPPARYHVADLAVARIAARRARTVPGVVALRPDLSQALLGLAAGWLSTDPVPAELRTDGVTAAVRGDRADVRLAVSVRLGDNCRELAATLRREVAATVRDATGLDASVRVTIADIVLP